MTLPLYEQPELAGPIAAIVERFGADATYHHTPHHVLPPGIDYDRLSTSLDTAFVNLLAQTGLPPSHQWLEEGDLDRLRGMLPEQARALDGFGNTLVHRAVLYPDGVVGLKMLQALLAEPQHQASLTVLNEDGRSPLDLARERAHAERDVPWPAMAATMIRQHQGDPGEPVPVPFERDEDEATPVDDELVAHCLEFGLHATVRTILDEAPWQRGNVSWRMAPTPAGVDLLIELGLGVEHGQDAIEEALIFRRPVALVEHLIARGAPVPLTAVHTAMGHPDLDALFPLLQRAGADPATLDVQGCNALLLAVKHGPVALVTALLDQDRGHRLLDDAQAHPSWPRLRDDVPNRADREDVTTAMGLVHAAVHRAVQAVADEANPSLPVVQRSRTRL